MKKKRLLLGFLSVLLVFTLVGCNNKKAENSNAKVLGVIGAMEEEVEILKSKMTIAETEVIAGMEFYKGTFEGKDIVLVRSGVGKVNMATCTQILIDKFNVTALINSGVAGTLNPSLEQGDIVISTEAVQHDFDTTVFGDPLGEISRLGVTFFEADQDMIEIAKEASKNVPEVTVKEGRIASGDQFVAGGEIAERIKSKCVTIMPKNMSTAALEEKLRLGENPVVGRISEDKLILDMRTVLEDEIDVLVQKIINVLK